MGIQAIKEDVQGENNLTSESDEMNPRTVTDKVPSKRDNLENILSRSREEEIDFDGITNPSLHKVNPNDLLDDTDRAVSANTKGSLPAGSPTSKLAKKGKSLSDEAIMNSLIQLISLNKRVSNYKGARLN